MRFPSILHFKDQSPLVLNLRCGGRESKQETAVDVCLIIYTPNGEEGLYCDDLFPWHLG